MTGIEVARQAVEHGAQLFRPRPQDPLQYDCKGYWAGGKKKGWVIIDSFSASAVVQVYDHLQKPENKEKFEHLPLTVMVGVAFKIIEKARQ